MMNDTATRPSLFDLSDLSTFLIGDWEISRTPSGETLALTSPERAVLASLTLRELELPCAGLPRGLHGRIYLSPLLSDHFQNLVSWYLFDQLRVLRVPSVELTPSVPALVNADLAGFGITGLTRQGLSPNLQGTDPTVLLVHGARSRVSFDDLSVARHELDEDIWAARGQLKDPQGRFSGAAHLVLSRLGNMHDLDIERYTAVLAQAIATDQLLRAQPFEQIRFDFAGASLDAMVLPAAHFGEASEGEVHAFRARSEDPFTQAWRQWTAQQRFAAFAASGGSPARVLARAVQLTADVRLTGSEAERAAQRFIETVARRVAQTTLD